MSDNNSYVYIKSEDSLYTVGFYEAGKWYPESDWGSRDLAADRVTVLNGGIPAVTCELISRLEIVLGEAVKLFKTMPPAARVRLAKRAQKADPKRARKAVKK